ncbi:MAG: hypothetical protein CVV03_12620, partial [Firmicutes bacterium HGW-Firmicutes-8]
SKIANDVSARETLIKYPTPPSLLVRPPEHTSPCAKNERDASFDSILSFFAFVLAGRLWYYYKVGVFLTLFDLLIDSR